MFRQQIHLSQRKLIVVTESIYSQVLITAAIDYLYLDLDRLSRCPPTCKRVPYVQNTNLRFKSKLFSLHPPTIAFLCILFLASHCGGDFFFSYMKIVDSCQMPRPTYCMTCGQLNSIAPSDVYQLRDEAEVPLMWRRWLRVAPPCFSRRHFAKSVLPPISYSEKTNSMKLQSVPSIIFIYIYTTLKVTYQPFIFSVR